MPAAPPTAPPRSRKKLTKQDISEPFDFVHCGHVGIDFKSEDVKNAIKPKAPRQPSTEHVYELVNRQETPILLANSARIEDPPPTEFAPEYLSTGNSTTSTGFLNTAPPAPAAPLKKREEVLDYENRPSAHIYMNINHNASKPRPSKKKNPPPPPPQVEKPKLELEEPTVAFRQHSAPTTEPPVEEAPKIETPKRIEAAPASIVVERPGLLGEMRLGLDDPIPLMTGLPSTYRSPTMLTPREMAVDVPTSMRTPEKKPESDQRKSRPLIKDVPPTPSVVIEPPKMIFPEPTGEQKRAAPVPPTEPAETTKAYNPYIPLSAARSSPQLKNVISELKTKQSKEDVVDDEENEYVRVNQRETKKHDPEMSTIKEEGQNEMESNKSNPEQNTTGKQIEQILTPVPKPRRTVAASVDVKHEENIVEETAEEVADDGIDTGCSDEDSEVIRL